MPTSDLWWCCLGLLSICTGPGCGEGNIYPSLDGSLETDGSQRFDEEKDVCGDRKQGSTEACDDGNTEGCDGCSADCRIVETRTSYYDDLDADGFGDPASGQMLYCPDGKITDDRDCDDRNPDVNPDQEEICGNQVDDNCDTRVDEDCQSDATIVVNPGDNWYQMIRSAGPGDIVEFNPGTYSAAGYGYSERQVTINGTAEQPIIIRSKGKRQAVWNGAGKGMTIRFEASSHFVVQHFVVTNPSPFGLDGRTFYGNAPDDKHFEGIVVGASSDYVIRGNLFREIATRGILPRGDRFLVERNVFTHVGHDTASGDINPTGGSDQTYRENLFAGSVDGLVMAGRTGGGIVAERNLCTNGQAEDCYDFKGVNVYGDGPYSHIRNNVIYSTNNRYSAITVQNESNKVKVYSNFIKGTQKVWVHGRSHGTLIADGVVDTEYYDNYLSGMTNQGFHVRLASDTGPRHRPVPIVDCHIHDNFFENVATPVQACCDTTVENNITDPTPQDRQAFEELEASIIAALCQEFSEQEIIEAISMSRSTYKGLDPSTLPGLCSGTGFISVSGP